MQAFIDSSDRCVVVTASSNEIPFDLKIWVYQPAKVGVVGIEPGIYFEFDFQDSSLFKRVAGYSNGPLVFDLVRSDSHRVYRISIHVTTRSGRTRRTIVFQ